MTGSAAPCYPGSVRRALLFSSVLLVGCPPAAGVCPEPLAGLVAAERLEGHLEALADIADAHGGTRAAGTPGYTASVEYVVAALAEAGLRVTRQPFEFPAHELLAPPTFAQVEPEPAVYVHEQDFRVAPFSGDGDVAGPVMAVDLALGAGNKSTSGCEPEDFAGFFPNSVALIQRGTCPHAQKITNAAAAGAAAVILFNQGDTEVRRALYGPRVPAGTSIPVVAVSYDLGVALSEQAGLVVRIGVEGQEVSRPSENVLAELPHAPHNAQVIMFGGHLDSVPAGPGINDNGSGVAAVLEVITRMRGCAPVHQVRAAFWGAEELGLLGSTYYVEALSEAERGEIAMYLNLDMVASPNPAMLIYDGDGSAFEVEGPPGSGEIEAAFAEHFAAQDVPTAETAFDGRSDYWAFIRREIPASGLFTGAKDLKTADATELFGGEVGVAYDACYHQACDDRDNYDPETLLRSARALAGVVERFAAADELPR